MKKSVAGDFRMDFARQLGTDFTGTPPKEQTFTGWDSPKFQEWKESGKSGTLLGITLHFLWFNLGGSFWKEENRKTSCQMPEECSFLCSFSRLSKEIENETHGGWWQQKTRTWNLHLLGDYIQMLLQYLSLVIQIHCLLIQCLRDYTEEFIGVEVSFLEMLLRFVRKKRDSPERRCLLSICWRVHVHMLLDAWSSM